MLHLQKLVFRMPILIVLGALTLWCVQARAAIVSFHVDPATGDVNPNGIQGQTGIRKITGGLHFDTSTGLASLITLTFDSAAPLMFTTAGYFGSSYYGNNTRSGVNNTIYYITAQSSNTSRLGFAFTLDTSGDLINYSGQSLTMTAGTNEIYCVSCYLGNWSMPILNLTFVPDVPFVSPAPEPATWGIMLLGILGLGLVIHSGKSTALTA